ncbi:aminotransferase class III-fold pyridoxal phosphate-dependent enzyme, partial [Klebsiella pneumoniae]
PVVADKALGGKIWDVDGREYLDWVGGIGVLNVGHNHPKVVRAVREQLERFCHTCFQVTAYEPYIRLAEKLCQSAPGDFEKKAFFVTTGAEATENAIKIARASTGRSAVIAF